MEFIRFPFPWNQTLYYNLFAMSQNSLACIPIHAQNIDDKPDKLYYMVFRFAMDFIFCPFFCAFCPLLTGLHPQWHMVHGTGTESTRSFASCADGLHLEAGRSSKKHLWDLCKRIAFRLSVSGTEDSMHSRLCMMSARCRSLIGLL